MMGRINRFQNLLGCVFLVVLATQVCFGFAAPATRSAHALIGSWVPSWFHSRFWPWNHEELHDIIVTRILPDGARAPPALLRLPESQMQLEGFQQEPAPKSSPDADKPWYTYNSSDAIPLIPSYLSWMSDESEMERRAGNDRIDLNVARCVSKLVAISYCNSSNLEPWNCTRCEPGFIPRKAIFDPSWDLQGFVGWSEELNAVVVSFRGTDSRSYYNWVENMRTWRTDLALSYPGMPEHAFVHGGFYYSYNNSFLSGNVSLAVADLVSEYISSATGKQGGGAGGNWLALSTKGSQKKYSSSILDDKDLQYAPTVYVAGHSLGGALATLASIDLKMNLKLPDVRLISFGSPRVGNAVFAEWFQKSIGPHWRFTHNQDIVPSLPPVYMGFRHSAQEIWIVDRFVDFHTLVGFCDGSGEDPKCHASVCHLGLCSSLMDHLLYFSAMHTPRPMGC